MDHFKENVQRGSFTRRTCITNEAGPNKKASTQPPDSYGNVTELSKISKEFTDKYLLKGKNFLHEGKIYHFGEPKNFSFSPSKVWLENFQRDMMSGKSATKNEISYYLKSKNADTSSSTSSSSKLAVEQETIDGFTRRDQLSRGESLRVDDDSFLTSRDVTKQQVRQNRRRRRSVTASDGSDDIDETMLDDDMDEDYVSLAKSTIPNIPEDRSPTKPSLKKKKEDNFILRSELDDLSNSNPSSEPATKRESVGTNSSSLSTNYQNNVTQPAVNEDSFLINLSLIHI